MKLIFQILQYLLFIVARKVFLTLFILYKYGVTEIDI